MLCWWIILFWTPATIAQFRKEDDYRCIIPDNDIVKNGNFTVMRWEGLEKDEQPPAGTKLLTYELEFQCDPGFFPLGNLYVRCVPLEMEEFPVCSDCGIVSNAPIALAGGRTAYPGDVPWQAAIYDKSTDPFMQICGGSIVSKDVIISAAHCFKLPDQFYAVAVGKIYRPYNNPLDSGAQKSEILEIRTPPRYRGSVTSFQDDIAAVILATPIVFNSGIKPVCLHFGADFDEVQLTPGKLGRVAGWGIDSRNGRPSQVLNLAEMPMVDIGTCFMLQDVSFIQYITSDKICAGYTNGTSLCKGDSGGGLAVPHKSGYTTRYYLRGIVSTGPQPATLNECNVNAVTTFTRVAKHEYFVKSAIAKKPLQENERRTPPIILTNAINKGANEGLPLKVDSFEQIDVFTKQRPVIGNSRDPQADAPGTVVITPDTPTDENQNIQGPLRDSPVQTDDFINQRPVIGNGRDPQEDAPRTVVIIPDTPTTDENQKKQVLFRDDSVQTDNFIQRPVIGNSRDPQADAPGTVVIRPDTQTTDKNQNTQVSLGDKSVQTDDFINQISVIGNSRDPQAGAPGTVVIRPDVLTTDENQKTQVLFRGDSVQTDDFINQRPVIGNSRDPQADAPGTVVIIPDILTTDLNQNTQVPLKDNPVQTDDVINQRPVIGNFSDSQTVANSTVAIISDLLTIDINRDTDDPLRGDSVQPIGIFGNQQPVFDSNHDPNVTTPDNEAVTETLTNTVIKNDEIPIKDSFIPMPVAELDDNDRFTDPNKKVSLDTIRGQTVPSMNKIVNSEGLLTTPNPQLRHGASDFSNHQHSPHLQMPYQHNPNQNLQYPSQNLQYPSQNLQYPSQNLQYPSQNLQYPSQNLQYPSQSVHHPSQNLQYQSQNLQYPSQNLQYPSQNLQYTSQNVQYSSQNLHYPNQNGHYPNQNEHQNPQNVEINEQFEHNWQYNNPGTSFNYQGQRWRK